MFLFILGHNATLSLAEIQAKWPEASLVSASKETALFNFNKLKKPEPADLDNMGGIVKIAEVFSSKVKDKNLIPEIVSALPYLKRFGLSLYGNLDLDARKLGFSLKEKLENSKRFVFSGSPVLSSESVRKNALLKPANAEIIITNINNNLYLAKTIACQNPRAYQVRDDKRPHRDRKLGMMPPRLAQIMINLTRPKIKAKILDPFCGLGTILQEGYLQGLRMTGTDVKGQVIRQTKDNLEHVKSKFSLESPIPKLLESSAQRVNKALPKERFDAVATEGYLGPISPNPKSFKSVWGNLTKLHLNSFYEFRKILKPNGKIVITFPVFFDQQDLPYLVPFFDKLLSLGYTQINPIPVKWKRFDFVQTTSRNTIIYKREGQKVGREICLFKIK